MDAHVSDSIDSAGAIGVGADADGLWAANSVVAGATAEIPLTQVYADEGVAEAQPLANMPALEADPFADMAALGPCSDDDCVPPFGCICFCCLQRGGEFSKHRCPDKG